MSEHEAAAEVENSAAAYHAFCRMLRSRGPTLNMLFEQARISPEREGDTVLRDAFAGALVSVLHGMHAGPAIRGCSVAQILAAALDNLRHFEQWDSEKTAIMLQHRSVRVLCALGIPLKKNSKHPPFHGNVYWAVLEAFGTGAGYGSIEALVREFAAG